MFSRPVSEDVAICWADGRSSGAAPTPDPPTPTDVPQSRRAPSRSGGKSVMRRNQLVNTQEQLGAPELRSGARCCVKQAQI